MRRRGAPSRLKLIAAGAAALLLALALSVSVSRYRAPPPSAPPEALARIAQKNRNAATIAAARQRSESAASTNAVDRLREAEENSSGGNTL